MNASNYRSPLTRLVWSILIHQLWNVKGVSVGWINFSHRSRPVLYLTRLPIPNVLHVIVLRIRAPKHGLRQNSASGSIQWNHLFQRLLDHQSQWGIWSTHFLWCCTSSPFIVRCFRSIANIAYSVYLRTLHQNHEGRRLRGLQPLHRVRACHGVTTRGTLLPQL